MLLYAGGDAHPEGILHDVDELQRIREVHVAIIRRLPCKLADQSGDEAAEILYREAHPWADPPSNAERHHLDALRPGHVDSLPLPSRHEPLRPKLQGIAPGIRVQIYLPQREVHVGPSGDCVSPHSHLLFGHVREHKVSRRVPPETLQNNSSQEGFILLEAGFDAEFFRKLFLHSAVVDDLGHDELQRGAHGDEPPDQELGAERHDLVLAELSPVLLGDLELRQGAQVGGTEEDVFSWRPGSLDQREEDVFMPLT